LALIFSSTSEVGKPPRIFQTPAPDSSPHERRVPFQQGMAYRTSGLAQGQYQHSPAGNVGTKVAAHNKKNTKSSPTMQTLVRKSV